MDANSAHQKGYTADEVTYEWHENKRGLGRYWLVARGRQIADCGDLMDVAWYLGTMRLMERRVAKRRGGC